MPYITGSKEQEDGQTFTSYSGFADSSPKPYQYKLAQDIVRIVNRGNRDITVNVNGSNTIVNAGKDASFVGPISQFTVNTSIGLQQAFIAESWIKSTSSGGSSGSGVLIVSTVAELLSSYPNGSAAPVWVTADNSWYYWSGALPTPDTTPPTVSISPTPGTFASAQSVTLTANEAATIYYTLDGSTPTTSSTPYSSAISVNSTTTLKYFAKDTAGNSSSVQTATYTIDAGAPPDTTPPNPVTGLTAGTPTSSSVPLSWTISNSGDVTKQEIAYSTDGTNFTVANGNVNPSTNSATVTGLAASTAYTFRIVAIDGANNRSTAVTTTATTGASASLPTIAFDDFNRSDNATTLGTTPTGSKTWEYKGTWGIASNKAILKTSSVESAAVIDAGKADYTASVKVGVVGSGQRLIVRHKSFTEFYAFQYATGKFTCYRFNPTFVSLGDSSAVTIVTGDVLKAECIGTTINFYVNNILVQTVTDGVFTTTGVKAGIGGNGLSYDYDEFTLQG